MERIKAWRRGIAYKPIDESNHDGSSEESDSRDDTKTKAAFSWIEYGIFLLLGVSMLWAWNMFLAAGPYFQRRFQDNAWVAGNFQAAELTVSTVANLGSMLVLTKLQANASYPKRIIASLGINMVVFIMLALSTRFFLGVSVQAYFGFLMVTVFATSLATGLCQNGIFAFVSGYGQGKYTQGIMTGQGVAGVLPCIAQIVLVLSVSGHHRPSGGKPNSGTPPPPGPPTPGKAAFAYFLTATAISVITLIAFLYLVRRHASQQQILAHQGEEEINEEEELLNETEHKSIAIVTLLRKLLWLAAAVFFTFAITMVFPVYTQQIVSVVPPDRAPPILQPPSFIPLAFLFWNSGDLIGRLITAVPRLALTHRPKTVFVLAVARVVFIPLYMLCNVRGEGAAVGGDAFYLVVVQLFYGISNGYIGSTCMMGAAEWVDDEEKEAAGGFMGLCLVAGLAVGSVGSFFVANG